VLSALRQLTAEVLQVLEDQAAGQVHRSAGGQLRLWNVPYPPHPCFTGRQEELERLQPQLQQRSVAAISGLGGIGKTHLAVEYASRSRSSCQAVL
jgi:Mrp family chromosome partitioning ATPase